MQFAIYGIKKNIRSERRRIYAREQSNEVIDPSTKMSTLA